MVLMTITGISSEVWSWCHFRTILLGVGLVSSSHGFGFIHSGVEVLDVLWRVQARGVVVLVGHNLGAKPGERQSAPVVARANVFYLLQKWTENLVCQDILWVNKEKVVSKCVCERTRMLTETCNTCRANMTRHLMPLAQSLHVQTGHWHQKPPFTGFNNEFSNNSCKHQMSFNRCSQFDYK